MSFVTTKPQCNKVRFQRLYQQAINLFCLSFLLIILGTVIYGLLLRAEWETNYYLAVIIAVVCGAILLIGLAQQEIAARDEATWRDMAEWQIRSTYGKMSAQNPSDQHHINGQDWDIYQEQMIESLINTIQGNSDIQARHDTHLP